MMVFRVVRAPARRAFYIDVGNVPPEEIPNYMEQAQSALKKSSIVDRNTGRVDLRYNPLSIDEDYFIPVRGGDSGTNIESLPGMQYETTDDIEYLKNRLLAALHVPKAFLGYEESLGSKATLAAEDVRFARTIERVQRILVSELTKIAVVHLYSQGYTDAELVNFELSLTSPSTIYEQEKIELWSNKINLARDMKDNQMMSTEWIYKHIFNFSDDQIKEMDKELVQDQKQKFRFEFVYSCPQ